MPLSLTLSQGINDTSNYRYILSVNVWTVQVGAEGGGGAPL